MRIHTTWAILLLGVSTLSVGNHRALAGQAAEREAKSPSAGNVPAVPSDFRGRFLELCDLAVDELGKEITVYVEKRYRKGEDPRTHRPCPMPSGCASAVNAHVARRSAAARKFVRRDHRSASLAWHGRPRPPPSDLRGRGRLLHGISSSITGCRTAHLDGNLRQNHVAARNA